MEPINVVVWAPDPLTRAGLCAYLRARPGVNPLPAHELARARLFLAAVDRFATSALRVLDHAAGVPALVLTRVVDAELLPELERLGVAGLLPFDALEGEQLMDKITSAAAGHRGSPLRMPKGGAPAGGRELTPRELAVVRLMSEGWSTSDIGHKLGCSERAVKGVVADVVAVLRSQNRPEPMTKAMLSALG
ncbi:helix-turn-helix transcriptional regulator [Amycolatopsis suaedae]|uniref:Response regulator transcription factor n=1 Tax=Amycolatopsis suaedae TaxID=2510978 RepID=A0A4Q7J1D3_9PSEU|nr:LuxR C-terminal-related transcriptional regulator [Amycolatopsis suaedae]RZQ60193.1 response regulator transcription factor [Amycolatopsis suaedae]